MKMTSQAHVIPGCLFIVSESGHVFKQFLVPYTNTAETHLWSDLFGLMA